MFYLAITCHWNTWFISNKRQKMPKFTALVKLFTELGYTIWFISDSRFITSDHQIPIGYNTFLRASTASSHDATAIKKVIKIFLLMCKWSIMQLVDNIIYILLKP